MSEQRAEQAVYDAVEYCISSGISVYRFMEFAKEAWASVLKDQSEASQKVFADLLSR